MSRSTYVKQMYNGAVDIRNRLSDAFPIDAQRTISDNKWRLSQRYFPMVIAFMLAACLSAYVQHHLGNDHVNNPVYYIIEIVFLSFGFRTIVAMMRINRESKRLLRGLQMSSKHLAAQRAYTYLSQYLGVVEETLNSAHSGVSRDVLLDGHPVVSNQEHLELTRVKFYLTELEPHQKYLETWAAAHHAEIAQIVS